jgi:hypothetical protein
MALYRQCCTLVNSARIMNDHLKRLLLPSSDWVLNAVFVFCAFATLPVAVWAPVGLWAWVALGVFALGWVLYRVLGNQWFFTLAWVGFCMFNFLTAFSHLFLTPESFHMVRHSSEPKWVLLTVPAILSIISLFLPFWVNDTERDPHMGFRTQWALADDNNWLYTNRVGFALLAIAVAWTFPFIILLPLGIWPILVMIAGIIKAVGYGSLYSWYLHKKRAVLFPSN